MKKFIISVLVIVLLSAGWGVIRFTAMSEGYGLSPIAPAGNTAEFSKQMKRQIDAQAKGNFAAAIIDKGELVSTHFSSTGQKISADSIFGVSSVSKWVTAMGVMLLVEQGKVSLDAPVVNYLTRWALPPSEFDNNEVTLRRLLSHTAGIEDGLGHNGFAPGATVQPLVEHLTQALDADPDVNGRVAVTLMPGSKWKYSGGSYNLIQLIIEEVSGQPFATFMQANVFTPLEMKNTGFSAKRESEQLAHYYGENFELRVYPNYTSLAATGMYTTINDLFRLVASSFDSDQRAEGTLALLSDESLQEMRQPVASVTGLDIWGSGVMLFAPTEQGHIIGHGGKSPYLNATARFDPTIGSGFIMFQTGNEEAFASNIATQWTLWLTGKPDMYMINNQMDTVIGDVIIGAIVITLLTLIGLILISRKRSVAPNAQSAMS